MPSSEHFAMPGQIIDVMVDTAAHFGGNNAIDPWLHEPAILRQASFAEKRVGLIPHETLWRQLVSEEPQLELRHVDVFREDVREQFDVVLWGPPWGEMVEWRGRRHRVEAFLLDRALELLAPGGVAVCLVPPTVLTAQFWSAARQGIVRDFSFEMTVEMPQELFTQNQIRPSMLVVRRAKPKKTVFMATFRADNDALLADFQSGSGDFHMPIADIRDRWDRNFHDPHSRAAVAQHLEGFPVRALGELAEVTRGLSATRKCQVTTASTY